jgi:large subunit ribosomal protein L1
MGKIRVKTLGDEKQEKQDAKKAQARADAKKAREEAEARHASAEGSTETKESASEEVKAEKPESEPVRNASDGENTAEEPKKEKKEYKKASPKKHKSASYQKIASLVDKNKAYKLSDALPLLEQIKRTKFDETVELHINTTENGISGSMTLPHGTGKATRVIIADVAQDAKAVDDLIKNIESGKIDFDVLVATPPTMSKLAKVARVLGPRGLMPNPKNGTVTQKPDDIAKKFAGGQFNYKTEAKFPILHLAVGKLSFGDKKLEENITTAVNAIKTKNIKDVTLKSTMSPGIKIEVANL